MKTLQKFSLFFLFFDIWRLGLQPFCSEFHGEQFHLKFQGMKIKGIGRNASESAHPVQTFLKAHMTLFCTASSWFGPNSMKKRQISMFWGYPLKFLLYCLPLENTQTQQSCRQKHQNAHFIIILGVGSTWVYLQNWCVCLFSTELCHH